MMPPQMSKPLVKSGLLGCHYRPTPPPACRPAPLPKHRSDEVLAREIVCGCLVASINRVAVDEFKHVTGKLLRFQFHRLVQSEGPQEFKEFRHERNSWDGCLPLGSTGSTGCCTMAMTRSATLRASTVTARPSSFLPFDSHQDTSSRLA